MKKKKNKSFYCCGTWGRRCKRKGALCACCCNSFTGIGRCFRSCFGCIGRCFRLGCKLACKALGTVPHVFFSIRKSLCCCFCTYSRKGEVRKLTHDGFLNMMGPEVGHLFTLGGSGGMVTYAPKWPGWRCHTLPQEGGRANTHYSANATKQERENEKEWCAYWYNSYLLWFFCSFWVTVTCVGVAFVTFTKAYPARVKISPFVNPTKMVVRYASMSPSPPQR